MAKRARRDSNNNEIKGHKYEQMQEGDKHGNQYNAQLCQAFETIANRLGAAIKFENAIKPVFA